MNKIILILCCLISFGATAQKVNYQNITIDSLTNYWNGLVAQRNVPEALACTEVLLQRAKAESSSKDTAYAKLLTDVASFYGKVNMLDKAIACNQEALVLFDGIFGKDHVAVCVTLINLATSFEMLGKAEEAKRTLEKCLEIIKKNKKEQSGEAARVYEAFGEFHRHQGAYEISKKWHTQSMQLYQKVYGEKSAEYSRGLNNLAGAYYGLGQFDEVLTLMLQSKAIKESTTGKNDPRYASALNNIALVYTKMSRYDQALNLYMEAKQIREQTEGKMTPDYAGLLTNIGNTYVALKKEKEAIPFLKESVEIRNAILGELHPKYATSLSNLGAVYQKMEQFEDAKSCFLQVQNIYKKNKLEQHGDYALLLGSIGYVHHKLGKNDLAEKLYKESIQIVTATLGEKHPLVASAWDGYGRFYFFQRKWDLAYERVINSIRANCITMDSVANKDGLLEELAEADFYSNHQIFDPLIVLLDIWEKRFNETKELKNIEELFRVTQIALRLVERFNTEMTSEKDKLFLLEKNIQFIDDGIFSASILMEQTKEKDKYLEAIFQLMERNKSILLMDATQSEAAYKFGNIPDSLYEKEQALKQQLNDILRQMAEPGSVEQKSVLQAYLNETHLEANNLKSLLKKEYPQYYNAKFGISKATIQEIQKGLDEETVLIEYFIADTVLYAFSIDKNSSQHHLIEVSKRALSAQTKLLRNALSNYDFIVKNEGKAYNDYTSSAHWFYQKLLQPILKDKKAKTLMIIADGELGHLPFEVFLTKAADGNTVKKDYATLDYLLNDYKISYNYAVSLFADALRNPKTVSNNNKILAIAGSYKNHIDTAAQTKFTRSPYLNELRKSLIELPAATAEVNALANLFQGEFVSGGQATESFFKSQKDKNYSIIHLAMHGVLNQNSAMLSGLVFTEDGDSLEDNFLQAFEISQMKLQADLVVLSACETGFGEFQQGEGVLSLARAFLYAGTPSMVVSLWQVNDMSTSVVMEQFYSNLAKGMDKAEALRQAKLFYIQNAKGIACHPAFWSPFIQLGDNKPIAIKPKTNWWLWAGIGGLVLAVAGGWWFRKK